MLSFTFISHKNSPNLRSTAPRLAGTQTSMYLNTIKLRCFQHFTCHFNTPGNSETRNLLCKTVNFWIPHFPRCTPVMTRQTRKVSTLSKKSTREETLYSRWLCRNASDEKSQQPCLIYNSQYRRRHAKQKLLMSTPDSFRQLKIPVKCLSYIDNFSERSRKPDIRD